MRIVLIVPILLGLSSMPAFGADARPPAFGDAEALAKGRALQAAVRAADPAPLWVEFAPAMRVALQDSAHLGATLRSIAGQTGPLDSCLTDGVERHDALLVYNARCRFARVGTPLLLQFAFDERGRIAGFWVKPDPAEPPRAAESRYLEYRTRTRLRLPAHGEWTVFWGGRTVEQNQHVVARDQRFAYDLVIVRNGSTHRGEGARVEDYYCYGQPIVAPAAGRVVWAEDGRPDQSPGQLDPAHPMGNAFVLDLGRGEFAVLAHLQPGSLRFVVGDSVAAGDTLGLCGNSGNTSEPHLHFHLQDGPEPFQAAGLPAALAEVMVDGKRRTNVELVRGQRVRQVDSPAGR